LSCFWSNSVNQITSNQFLNYSNLFLLKNNIVATLEYIFILKNSIYKLHDNHLVHIKNSWVIIINWNVSLYLIIVLAAFYWNTDYVSLFIKMGWWEHENKFDYFLFLLLFCYFFFNIWCLLEWLFSINRINCLIYDSHIIILIFLIYFPWKKSPVYFCISKAFFLKKIFFYLLQINIFLVLLDHFDVLISKIILKK
jgi:hypothetical protein